METITEIQEKIAAAENDFRNLWTRMDADKDLYRLVKYVMKSPDGHNTVSDVVNVTLNDPLTDTDRIMALLTGANLRPKVEGRRDKKGNPLLADEETSLVENFLRDLWISIDDLLIARQMQPLLNFLVEQICIRGRLAARCMIRMEDDKFYPDLLPMDTRNVVYGIGKWGLNWYAEFLIKSKELLKEEYNYTISNKESKVVEYWSANQHIIYLKDNYILREEENTLGYVPVVIAMSGVGSMLQDRDHLEYSGESVFSADRHLYPLLNRFASILATLTDMSFRAGLEYHSSAGEQKNLQEMRSPQSPGSVTPVEIEGGFKAIPVNDIKNAARQFYAVLETRRQRGGLPAIMYGDLTSPLSGTAISRLKADIDLLFMPRIKPIQWFYEQLSRMAIKQYIDGGFAVELGHEGLKQIYKAKDLKKDYSVRYEFHSQIPEENILNYSMAAAARGFVSDDTIRRQILKLPNPDAEKREMDKETAERVHPAIFFYEKAHSLVDEGKDIEAKLMLLKGLQLLEPTPPSPEEPKIESPVSPPGASPLVPLMGAGGGGGQRSRFAPEELRETESRREEGL